MATDSHSGDLIASNDWSAARRTQERHASHHVTLSDASDEDLVRAPPPDSYKPQIDSLQGPSSTEELLLPKAVDEQGNSNEGRSPKDLKAKPRPIFDPQSEDAFPALGAGPKPQVGNNVAPAWGSKKHTSVEHGHLNGINGSGPISNATSSRALTPASGTAPASTNASGTSQPRGLSIPRMTMPGKHSERIQFSPSQLLPRDQLKKPLADIVRAINKRSKAVLQYKLGPSGTLSFEATGPPEATRQALIDVAKEVGSNQSVKIPIPRSVRAHVIGKQGGVIQRIQKQTGARINIPKAEGSTPPGIDEDDDSITIDVLIEGDAVSAESARKEIEAIVNERTSTVNMRLHDIPPEYFPFIAGPRCREIKPLESEGQVKVQVPHYYTWARQPPAQPSVPGAAPQFNVDPSLSIRISGDRLAAQRARAKVEQQVNHLRRDITLSQIAINRGQHQFIAGEEGDLLHDLLEETGCAVILPPNSDDTEMLSVTGPRDRIDLGIEKVMSLAASMQMASVDIARQHPKAPKGPQAHARAVSRYLHQRRAIAQLEIQHNARIVLPNNVESPMSWEVYARDGKNTIRARSDIMKLINAYPPARVRHVTADPFFHDHLQSRVAQDVRDQFGVHLFLPDPREQSREIILVCEGPARSNEEFQLPQQPPTENEVSEFEKLLNQAQAHIVKLLQSQEEIGVASVKIPQRLLEKARSFVSRTQKGLPSTEIPVQIRSGQGSSTNGSAPISLSQSDSKMIERDITLRGPKSAVEQLVKDLEAYIEAEKQDELDRGHLITFEFPAKYANYLIGRKGETINKYREEFDVEIQVNDGKVEIKGPQAKSELAKAKILALRKKLENEVTHVLKINAQYHRDMIGAKGNQVNRLQDRYNVRVQFPRTAHAINDEKILVDGGSDAGGSRTAKSNQAPDEVIIRGPKKGADEAKDELLNLLQWTIDNSHASTVSVAQSQLPSLIGQGGREVESLRLTTGAQIDVPGHRDVADSSGRIHIRVKGTKKQVEEAKKQLEQRAKAFDNTVTKSIHVDKKHHKALIGSGGSNIRGIVIAAGGPDDRRDLLRTVRFPRQDSNDDTIQVECEQAVVDKIIASIENFVRQKDSQASRMIEVAPEKHRLLIGRDGETRRKLESQFGISLDIPKLSQQGAARSQIKLTGLPGDVDRAQAHIMTLVKDQDSETVLVPRRIHLAISDNGSFFRRLRNDHQVTVDHAGEQPPHKSTGPRYAPNRGQKDLPLITDDQIGAENYTWEVVDINAEQEGGEIPWVLRGPSTGVSKARTAVEKAIEQGLALQESSTGYLVLPDARSHRFIVGQGGSQINSIRKQTGCRITIPRDKAEGEAIEIIGSREGVEHAKEIILDIVQQGGKRGNGVRRD